MSAVADTGFLNDAAMLRRRRWRMLGDRFCAGAMAAGGISVIIAILLIFVYLLYVVIPLFRPADIGESRSFPSATSNSLLMAVDEYAEIGMQVGADGQVHFLRLADGGPPQKVRLPVPEGTRVTAAAAGDPASGIFAAATDHGTVMVARQAYAISYPDDVRHIEPQIEYPLGSEPLRVDPAGREVSRLALQSDDSETTLAVLFDDGTLRLVHAVASQSLLGDTTEVEVAYQDLPAPSAPVTHLALDLQQRELWIASSDGRLTFINVADKSNPTLADIEHVTEGDETITALDYLSGGVSVLVGFSSGRIAQWLPLRQEDNSYQMGTLRDFSRQAHSITAIIPEYFRKGFAAIDESGTLALYHTTAHRTVARASVTSTALVAGAYNSRANTLLLLDDQNQLHVQTVHNEHPEVSWQSIWGMVWYENRQEPEYIWQSSSASSDFEPKFSLTPLTFGTLKAAFYAMLFAVPLAIFGAIYTAYFMSPEMRNFVKPSIEIMEALPTVILGFLAGLWLAPLVEANLPGVFMTLIALPITMLVFAFVWSRLPRLRNLLPPGWEALLLIPVVILAVAGAMLLSRPMELLLFDGNMPLWITRELGLGFDQRNSLVVGFAMGFAVIPTIFSISEDAVFSVPRHLTTGSLALGATPWQTMVRVVILTASPGIFSGVMIGLGRAVGETMIVLMATGNTAIMDLNIFQGFRALSANIAVEMPESEVNSTHYRILFLAALVLFMVTFLVNTAAELVRQRLRRKYSSL